jgi:hypothetical protein
MPLTELLHICSSTVDWLGQQLTAVGLPGVERGAQQAQDAQKAAEGLMPQHSKVAQMLQDAAAAARKPGITRDAATSGPDADDTVGAPDASSRGAEALLFLAPLLPAVLALASKLVSLWPDLQAFASQLFFACPVASFCGNPGCLTISSLSEWQMLNGKLCRCAGCKVARFCSKPYQNQVWREHHKPVCKRLKVLPGV